MDPVLWGSPVELAGGPAVGSEGHFRLKARIRPSGLTGPGWPVALTPRAAK
jgi:hypothetical protein